MQTASINFQIETASPRQVIKTLKKKKLEVPKPHIHKQNRTL